MSGHDLISHSIPGLNAFPPNPASLAVAVVSFMQVFNKSRCQTREVLVDIYKEYPDRIEHTYIPACVILKRCSGCCNDEAMECVPTRTRNVTMEVSTCCPYFTDLPTSSFSSFVLPSFTLFVLSFFPLLVLSFCLSPVILQRPRLSLSMRLLKLGQGTSESRAVRFGMPAMLFTREH